MVLKPGQPLPMGGADARDQRWIHAHDLPHTADTHGFSGSQKDVPPSSPTHMTLEPAETNQTSCHEQAGPPAPGEGRQLWPCPLRARARAVGGDSRSLTDSQQRT